MRKKRELIFCKSEKMRRAKREKIYYLLAYEKEKLSGNGKKYRRKGILVEKR